MKVMAKLLIVEDEEEIRDKLKSMLIGEGHIVETASRGDDAFNIIKGSTYDVIVLDWNLPGMSGYQICRQFREDGGTTPIIFLTGMNDIASKEGGLDSGADDYLTKPFEFRELSARIRTVLRRVAGKTSNELKAGDLVLSTETKLVTVGAQRVRLTQRETSLLEYMLRNPNKFFSATDLRKNVWPSEGQFTDESVRTCVKTLRQKLDELSRGDLVKTVPGSGYILEMS
jgi:DNA-binding response OmpR family regulator